MKEIILITDPKVLSIPIMECHEPLIDLKDQQALLYGPPPPECGVITDCYTKIRLTVFEKLCQAQIDLPNHWRFRLYEGFRSLQIQQALFEHIYQNIVANNPHADKQTLFYETTRLVSPVINFDGTQNIPAHNTGGAIDIEIVTATGELIDMGMTAKDWRDVPPELCQTYCDFISKTAQQNRILLLEILEAHGFVNYPTEWWHFSYGDRYWAYHQQVKYAIYGSADSLL